MKTFLLVISLAFLTISAAWAQTPAGKMTSVCATVYGPNYNASTKVYSVSGSCLNGNRVRCATDPIDDRPIYHCQSNGNQGQDPDPSVAADKTCGCLNN